MRHVIDRHKWERWDNFRFFMDFVNPYCSVTTELACGEAKRTAKERRESFFQRYLYAILRAVNDIEAFRYRLEGEDPGQIVLYDTVDVLTVLRVGEGGRFFTVRIPYCDTWEAFRRQAQQIMDDIPANGDPFAREREVNESGRNDVIHVSAIPELYFTSVAGTQKHGRGSDYPLINVGGAFERDGRMALPVAVSVHHGFVDGYHIAEFVSRAERYLAEGF